MTVLKAKPRESYRKRLLISRNFEDSSEIMSVVSLGRDCGGLSLLTISIVLLLGVAPC